MDDILVIKAADHVDDGVGHADVAQKLVAQALAPGGALHQSGDVHELDDGGGGLFGVIHLRQLVQPVVGHGHHAHVGVDGAEGIVGALRAGVGDGVEQGRFANIRKTHNTQLHVTHFSFIFTEKQKNLRKYYEISRILSFRGAQRRGNPFSASCGRK